MTYAFHNQTAAMHTAHPEIEVLQKMKLQVNGTYKTFYNFDLGSVTQGTALYEDKYVKTNGQWLIQHSEYDRIWEQVSPINSDNKFTKFF